ncbi:MAG: cytochrome c biogenesis protein CcsA [Saprospiraceae bacterium]|nr:cytochrome c biogenesis protein CcsA [Saprospiraceae bacterium]MCB0676919.1 cytochrome c biogenesis protein CcsA [Saprospiraceae bacterium]MCB0680987.1 cytochrome c biogenesis protein CcsA [Saprospiraceae bacterium]
MLKHWWKILGVAILFYVFVAGLLVPLKTGISAVSPQKVAPGESFTLEVTGYNSRYTQAQGQIRAWLKQDEAHALAAGSVTVLDDRRLQLAFAMPEYLPSDKKVQVLTLLIDDPVDGAHVLPSAMFVTQDSIAPGLAGSAWTAHPVEGLHEEWTMSYPFRNILQETIRNAYFHIPMWFAMIFIFIGAVISSVRYLRKFDPQDDLKAAAFTRVGILYGIMGLVTGAIWAKNTWGAYWSGDIKQNMTAIALLIYLAYFVLRNAFEDPDKKARVAAVYNLFSFAALIPLIYVVPRLYDSLHPGSGGNPALGGEDLDNTMRLVFYPAIIGWTLLGLWIAQLLYRADRLRDRLWMNA